MIRVVVIALCLATAGCQRPSDSSASAERPEVPRSNDGSAAAAIANCRQELDDGDYLAANDFLMAAMRVAPESPDVFAAAMDFVRSAANSDDDLAVHLGNDVYIRADGLIPFQPIEQIVPARRQYAEAADAFSQPQQVVAPPIDEGIAEDLAILKRERLPHDVASLVLDRAHAQLDAMAVDIARASLGEKQTSWDRWTEAKTQLEEAEFRWLTATYAENRRKLIDWKERIAKMNGEYQDAAPTDLYAISDQIVTLLDDGNRLRAENIPFVGGGVTAAKEDQAKLNDEMNALERTREWIYNQHALATITSLDDSPESAAVKLNRIAEYDDRRLAPYVLRRFEERWSNWFDELESEAEKVEATKARVLRGAKP